MNENNHASGTETSSELIDYSNNLDKLNRWTIPSEKPNKIYNIGMLDFKSRFAIKTVQQTLRMSETNQTISLINKKDLLPYFKDYNFVHIGLIQIAFKPLTLLGMNASIMAYVRDARCRDFKPSLADKEKGSKEQFTACALRDYFKKKYPRATEEEIMVKLLDHMKQQFFNTYPTAPSNQPDEDMLSQSSKGSQELSDYLKIN